MDAAPLRIMPVSGCSAGDQWPRTDWGASYSIPSAIVGTRYEVVGRSFLAIDLDCPPVGTRLKSKSPKVDRENRVKVYGLIPVQWLLHFDLTRNFQPLQTAWSWLLDNVPAFAEQTKRDLYRCTEMIGGNLEEHDDRVRASASPGDCPAASEEVDLTTRIRLGEVG